MEITHILKGRKSGGEGKIQSNLYLQVLYVWEELLLSILSCFWSDSLEVIPNESFEFTYRLLS